MKLIVCIFALVAAAMSDPNEEALKAANDQFTARMFQEVVKSQGDKSVILSAFSVLSPLAQLGLASTAESHDEILRAIGFSSDDETRAVFTDVNSRLRSVKGVELKQANKVYVKKGAQLNDDFAAMSKQVFNSEVQNIDFTQSAPAAAEINKWVEDQTNKRIKDLVDPDSLDGLTAAVLVNAIYFKGNWEKRFNKNYTADRDFFVTKDKKTTVPMMHRNGEYQYGESAELDAKLLELPYEGQETSLVIVLPNKIDGINELISKISDPTVLNKAVQNMFSSDVDVLMPKFKIETTTDLKDILPKLDIKRMFQQGNAHLDNLLKGENDLYVSSATQKAFIEVNEDGVEAAAANQFTAMNRSGKLVFGFFQFIADRPFYYALINKNIVLFNGVFRS